jgi:hypothetical protein
VIFATELEWPDGPLDGVGVGLDAAVLEKQAEPFPMPQRVADGAGQRRFGRYPCELRFELVPSCVS